MRKGVRFAFCLGACLLLIACPSRQSAPGPDKAAALRSRIDLLNGALAERGLAARIFGDLNVALPDSAWLTEAGYDGAAVRAKGYAPSNTVAADYVSRLGGSPSLADVNLQTSVERRFRNRDWQEFSVQASVRGAHGQKGPAPGGGAGAESEDIAALTARLSELEKNIPTEKDSAGILRQLQMAADESGLKITKFAPGAEVPGEFYTEWPISIEVTGSRQALGRFLGRIDELPRLWRIRKFSFKTVSAQDADSPVRASLTAQTCFLQQIPAGSR